MSAPALLTINVEGNSLQILAGDSAHLIEGSVAAPFSSTVDDNGQITIQGSDGASTETAVLAFAGPLVAVALFVAAGIAIYRAIERRQ